MASISFRTLVWSSMMVSGPGMAVCMSPERVAASTKEKSISV